MIYCLADKLTDTRFDRYEILFYVKPVDKGQITTVKRLRNWCFQCEPFIQALALRSDEGWCSKCLLQSLFLVLISLLSTCIIPFRTVSLQHQNSTTVATGTKGLIIIIPILFDRQTVSGWLAGLQAGCLAIWLTQLTSVFFIKTIIIFCLN